MANTAGRYPATDYTRDLHDWTVTAEGISQQEIPRKMDAMSRNGNLVLSGPLREQLPDGRDGEEFGAVSIVWGQAVQKDGSRKILGWYETGR